MDSYRPRDERYESRRTEEREERRRYEADVYYDAWRRGEDPDAAVQRADRLDHFERGVSAEQSAESFCERARRDRIEERELRSMQDEEDGEIPF